jgi:hypothetical protein
MQTGETSRIPRGKLADEGDVTWTLSPIGDPQAIVQLSLILDELRNRAAQWAASKKVSKTSGPLL